MKICLLADASSSHTVKWCDFLTRSGFDVHVISFNDGNIDGVKVHKLGVERKEMNTETSFKKFKYLMKFFNAKKIVKEIKPDIVHAHYASSYGLLGSYINFKPYILSVWGSDIYLFPKKGKVFEKILRYNLKKADVVFSTSRHMAEETSKYTSKKVEITPFGIDINKFKVTNEEKDDSKIRICIVKSLEKVYGIELLVQAFFELQKKYTNIELVIGGGGTLKESLMKKCSSLGIQNQVQFLGKLGWSEIVEVYNNCHFAVFPSISESFGVSALEAQACGVPVIVSNVGGFPEVVSDKNSGFVFESGDIEELKKYMEKLINSKQLRDSMGLRGRRFVLANYTEEECFKNVMSVYDEILK